MQHVDRLLMTLRPTCQPQEAAASVIANGAFNVSRTLRALNRRGLAPPA